MGLTDLPLELLGHIVSFNDDRDLKSLRLVSNVFEIVASRHLFAHLTLWLQATCLQRLVKIARHSRLCHYVQSLKIGNEWLDVTPPSPERFIYEFVCNHTQPAQRRPRDSRFNLMRSAQLEISRGDFEAVTLDTFRHIGWSVDYDLNALSWSHERLFTAYKKCGNILLEHKDFIEQKADILHLASAIENLPNLRRVNITGTIQIDKVRIGVLVRRGKVDSLGTLLQGKHRSWGVQSVAQQVMAVRPREDGRHFGVFLSAVARIHESKSRLVNVSELHVDDSICRRDVFHKRDIFASINSTTVRTAALALRQLRNLTLPLGYGDTTELGPSRTSYRELDLLSALPLLESLAIQVLNLDFDGDAAYILQGISTQSLRSLSLERLPVCADTFKDFLKKHARTLRSLTFINTRLYGCRLEELFRFMRENMSLEELVFEGHLTGYNDSDWGGHGSPGGPEMGLVPAEPGIVAQKSIADYVTRKSDRYPLYEVDDGIVHDWLDATSLVGAENL